MADPIQFLNTDIPTLSIDTSPQPQPQQLSVDTSPTVNNATDSNTAALRAAKVQFSGLGNTLGKDFNQTYTDLMQGQERALRTQAATQIQLQNQKQFNDGLTQLAQERGGTLTPADIDFYRQKNPINPYPVDPDSVFERAYANAFVNTLDQTSQGFGYGSTQGIGDNWFQDAVSSIPNTVLATKQIASEVIAKQQAIHHLQQNVQTLIDNQGIGTTLGNIAFTLGTLGLGDVAEEEFRLRGLNNTGFFSGGLSLEQNLKNAATKALNAPTVEDMLSQVTPIVDHLVQHDPRLAQEFLSYFDARTSAESNFSKITEAANLATIPGIGTVAKAAVRGVKSAVLARDVAQAAQDMIKAAGEDTVNPRATAAAAAGDNVTAAIQSETKHILSNYRGNPTDDRRAIEALASGLKTDREDILNDPTQFGKPIANIIAENYLTAQNNIYQTISNLTKIMRIPLEQAAPEAIRRVLDEVKPNYPGIDNAIIDQRIRLDQFGNWWRDAYIGNHGGDMFGREEVLKTFANVNGITNYRIGRQGLGRFIIVSTPLNETSPAMRDILGQTRFGQSRNQGMLNWLGLGWLSGLRSAEDTVSFNQRVIRKIATYGQGNLRALADGERDYLQSIKSGAKKYDPVTGEKYPWYYRATRFPYDYIKGTVTRENKARWERLKRTLKDNQTMPDPSIENPSPIDKGYFFKNIGELEEYYTTTFGQPPNQEEIMAYFAHKRLNEYDRALRGLRLYNAKTRLGVQSHSIVRITPSGKKMASDYIDAKENRTFPGGDDAIMVVRNNKVYVKPSVHNFNTKFLNGLREEVKQGKTKVLELFNPDDFPLENWAPQAKGYRIRWVVADNVDTKPLPYQQIPRRGGGHWLYDYEHWVKQPQILAERIKEPVINEDGTTKTPAGFRHTYIGDNTLMPAPNRAEGQRFAQHMNNARKLLADGDTAAAKDYVTNNLSMDYDTFKSWFLPKRDPDGNLMRPRFNLTEDFEVVPRNSLVGDLDNRLQKKYYKTFKDGTRTGSLARVNQVEFTQARDSSDMLSFKNVGSLANPVYQYAPAELVDPIPMMNRALQRMMSSTFMDDFKVASIESWIQEAKDYLNADIHEIQYAPYHFFNQEGKLEWRKNAPSDIVNLLEQNRKKIRQFIGQPSKVQASIHNAKQKLIDAIYGGKIPGVKGAKAADRVNALVPEWLLDKVTHAPDFLRGVTFHTKLGLFNFAQFIVQQMSWVTIASLAPRSTPAAVLGMILHQWARLNPNMIDALDRIASHPLMRIPGFHYWKPGEWKEAFLEGRKTGFMHVGGEYINIDDLNNYQVVRSFGRNILDWGQTPFREGERSVRFGAWYAAHKEFRVNRPLGRITELDRGAILNRADDLNTNMSRASASIMNKGFFSLPLQFLNFQMRLFELMWSKRIGETVAQRNMARMRMFAFYTAMFGLPFGGLGLLGIPVGSYLREKAIEHNYVIGNNYITTALMEGLPAMALAMITGGGDIQKGNFYNFGSRYGTTGIYNQAFDPIRRGLQSDIPWWAMITGASGSSISAALYAAYPAARGILSFLENKKTSDPTYYPLRAQDMLEPMRQISSFNATMKALGGLQYHQWLSANGTFLSPVTSDNAVFQALTGMQDQRIEDALMKKDIMDQQDKLWATQAKRFNKDYAMAYRALANHDPEQAADSFRAAYSWLVGVPHERIAAIVARANKQIGDLIDSVDREFYAPRNTPEPTEPNLILPDVNFNTRRKAYQQTEQIKRKQRGEQ